VHIAQARLEPQHALADDREAEMSRLDDAGMHRSYRHLVHAFAFDPDERIAGIAGGELRLQGDRAAQRERAIAPGPMAQPSALVVARAQAQEVADRPLHAGGGGEDARGVRVAFSLDGKIKAKQALVHDDERMDRERFVAPPERAEPRALLLGCLQRGEPALRVDRAPLEARAHPMSCAARRYHSAR
jgi:hypothetical protein